METDEMNQLAAAFKGGLIACLEECALGRGGLFRESVTEQGESSEAWIEAANIRKLATAIQAAFCEEHESYSLCEEFLELCSINFTYNEEERKLANAFLERITKGEVGSPMQKQRDWNSLSNGKTRGGEEFWDQSLGAEDLWDQSLER